MNYLTILTSIFTDNFIKPENNLPTPVVFINKMAYSPNSRVPIWWRL